MESKKYNKVLSFRIHDDVLQAVNAYWVRHPYWSRSDIINIALRYVFDDADESTRFNIMFNNGKLDK